MPHAVPFALMHTFWPSSGCHLLQRDARGWLRPTDAYWHLLLGRPELLPLAESCDAERALHAALMAQPLRPVADSELDALRDPDARDNHALFLRWRDALQQAGSLEAFYLDLFRQGPIRLPPLFIDLVAWAVVRNLLGDTADAQQVRAAELLFRPQRMVVHNGRVLAGDRETLDLLSETAGLGAVGRLLVQGGAAPSAAQLPVLDVHNASQYWETVDRFQYLFDLTHELTQDLGHGLVFQLTQAFSGLSALATVLERWVAHFLGVVVTIQPAPQISDPAWRWHIGLDGESTTILNDLYQGQPVDDARMGRLISLFRLDFADPAVVRADVAGRPVYLGLAMNADGVLRLKPQNLLLNLPLAHGD